jgi:hypothetical protein
LCSPIQSPRRRQQAAMSFANKNRVPPPLTGTVAQQTGHTAARWHRHLAPPYSSMCRHSVLPSTQPQALPSSRLASMAARRWVALTPHPVAFLLVQYKQRVGSKQEAKVGEAGGEARSGEVERSEASAGFHGVGVVLAIDGDSSVGGCGHEEPHGAGCHGEEEEEKEMVVSFICASRSRTRSRCSRSTSNMPKPCECLCSPVFVVAALISRLQQLLPTAF